MNIAFAVKNDKQNKKPRELSIGEIKLFWNWEKRKKSIRDIAQILGIQSNNLKCPKKETVEFQKKSTGMSDKYSGAKINLCQSEEKAKVWRNLFMI